MEREQRQKKRPVPTARLERKPSRRVDPEKFEAALEKGLRDYDKIWQSLAKK